MSAPPSTPDVRPQSRRPWPLLAAAALLVALLVAYPPIRFGGPPTLGANSAAAFNPAVFAEAYWHEKLLPAAAQASALASILPSLRRDPTEAARDFGRKVGLGNAAYFFARGDGRITAVERGRLLVAIDGSIIAVRTGPVFGNVVRDGSGLVDVNEVPGLAEFNALSAELNRMVEERVQPKLQTATVGANLTFVGMAEAPEFLPGSGPLLTFVPVVGEVSP
jgi:predicted lipoprotein